MNLKQLEAFVRIAELKSFSKAAKYLYLTQPTVSAHIASLEKELGEALFIRDTKGVELSEAGRELYAYAEQMLVIEKKIQEHFEYRKRGKSVLHIAASTIPSQYLLPEIMARFRERWPEEQLKVTETDSTGVVDELLSRRADIGFTGTVLDDHRCIYIPFYEDELVVITPGTEPFLSLQGSDPEKWIRKEPVILREEGSGTRREAGRLLAEAGVALEDLNIVASIQNQETIKRSVGNGMGISILSALAAEEEIRSGRLLAFPLRREGGKRNINLVFEKEFPLMPAAGRFIDVMENMYPGIRACCRKDSFV